MKLITRDTDYAIRALCYIAKQKRKKVAAAELVGKLKIPRPFLRKILQILTKERILVSQKGAGGGFSLALPHSQIRLAEVMSVFQGSLSFNECVFKKELCPNRNTCPLRKKIGKIEENIIRDLQAIKLSDLVKA